MAKNLDIIVDVKSTNNLKEMKKELKDLKSEMLGLKEGSAEFQRAQARAGELQDTLGDLSERVKVFASDTKKLDAVAGVGKVMANGFQIATGAAALLGNESKQLEAAMQKIIITQGILNAVNEISNYIKGQGIVQDKVKLMWTNLQTQATKNQTATQKVLNLVMKQNPVFLLIGAFTTLTAAYLAFGKSATAADRAQVKLNEAMGEGDKAAAKEESSIKILTMKITSNTSSLIDKKDAIKQLNEIAPEYLGNITLENIGTQDSIDKIRDYIQMVRTKAEIQALEAQLQESISARLTLMRHKEMGTLDELGIHELIRLGKLAEEESQILSMIHIRQQNIDSIDRESETYVKTTDKNSKKRKEAHDDKVKEYKYEISTADQARLDLAQIEILNAKTVEARAIAETNYLKLQHEIQIKDKSLTDTKILLMEAQLAEDIKAINDSYMDEEEQRAYAELDLKKRTAQAEYDFKKKLDEQTKKRKQDEAEEQKKRAEEQKKRIQDETNSIKTLQEKYNESNKSEVDAIKEKYRESKSELDQMLKYNIVSQEEYDEQVKQLNIQRIQELTQQITEEVSVYTQAALDILSGIDELLDQRDEQRAAQRETKYKEEEESLKASLANREITTKEYENSLMEMKQQQEQEDLQMKRKSFKRDKSFNLANAIVSTAQAVALALASSPPPLNFISAGTTGALGGLQIAKIASSKFTAARGGIVPGSGPSNIDSVPSLLAPGEAVINANSTKMFGSLLSQINEMGGGISLTPDVGVSNSSIFRSNGPQVVEAFMVEKNATELQRQVARYKNRGKIK